jgi:hypothetical protein
VVTVTFDSDDEYRLVWWIQSRYRQGSFQLDRALLDNLTTLVVDNICLMP